MTQSQPIVPVYMIGHPVPGWKGPEQTDGARCSLDAGGVSFTFLYDKPTGPEVSAFGGRDVRFAVAPGGLHTLLVLLEIPGMGAGWVDMPWTLGIVSPDYRRLPTRKPTEGWLTMMTLVDRTTGVLHAMRVTTMTPEFCDILDGLIEHQRKNLDTFTPARHRAEIEAMHRRCPRPSDMLDFAARCEKGGVKFAARFQKPT